MTWDASRGPLDAEGRDEWTALNARSIAAFEDAERLKRDDSFSRA